jgi:hypothetical protein
MTSDNPAWTAPEITGPISRAAAQLENLLAADAFQPRLHEAPFRGALYAELVKPVAQSLFSLAVAGGRDCVMDLDNTPPKIYEVTHINCGERAKVYMPNQFSLQVVNPLVSPGNVWGPGGKFGLYGIILEVGSDRSGPQAELTLILSTWTDKPETEKPQEVALIGFNTRGLVRASCLRGAIHGQGFNAPVERDMAVRYMLGLEPCEGFVCDGVGGGSIDDRLGFPFAEEVLIGKMSLLNEYLRGCADRLTQLKD